MYPRQPLPRLWLMTDERLGEMLWPALAKLPRGGGVIFRHYTTPEPARRLLWRRCARIARARGLLLIRAGRLPLPGEQGAHNARNTRGLRTGAAHTRAEAIRRHRAGCGVIFVSPVFATRSHPDAPALGPVRAAAIGRGLPMVRVTLGGVDARRFRRLSALGFDGWAAIDAWTTDQPDVRQKRNAVPT